MRGMHLHISTTPNSLNKRILLVFLLLISPVLFIQVSAQFKATKVVRSSNITLIDGAKYYMHEIKEGQTLYSVSKAYNVSQEVISKENTNVPHLTEGTLPLGVVIRIPYVEIAETMQVDDEDPSRFFYHTVQPKETLSSLSRLYKIHYKKIIEYNPGVETRLPIGIELRIPKPQTAEEKETIPVIQKVSLTPADPPSVDTSYVYHTVQEGQNTIRVAALYGIKVRDLRKANPHIRWSLEQNEVLRIPKNLITNLAMIPDTTEEIIPDEIEVIVEEEEMEPEIITNSKCLELLRPHDKQLFEVAFLLPLYLDTNDTLHLNDTLPYSTYDIYDVRFLEFLEGAYEAIDSLRNSGINMNVRIYDTEKDPSIVRDLFESGTLDKSDLIIGPVYSKPLAVASEFVRARMIPLISPLSASGTGLEDNPYIFQVNPGIQVQYELASQYLANFYDMNIIMVQDTSSLNPTVRKSGSKIFDYLIYELSPYDLISGNVKFQPATAEELPENAKLASVKDMLSRERENLILIPSNNSIFITDIINKLNALALNYDITVFGRPEWAANETIELEYLYNLNLHHYTNFSNPYVNYSDSLVLDFCRKYRDNWNNEPNKYSFQGFDITYYFFKALYLYGNEFINCIECWENVLTHPTLQTDFCFRRVEDGEGFENQSISIVRYNSDTLTKDKIDTTRPIKSLEKLGLER